MGRLHARVVPAPGLGAMLLQLLEGEDRDFVAYISQIARQEHAYEHGQEHVETNLQG